MPDPTTPKRFRTVLHGTCLLGGKHPPGSTEARECPLAKMAKRSEARRRAWLTRKARTATPPQPDPRNQP